MSFWDTIFGKTPPPGAPGGPPRQLTLPRLLNTLVNPYAVSGGSVANFGKDVYRYEGYGPDIAVLRDQFRNPFPIWIGCDLSLAALKTARGHFPIPKNFYLLNYWASSSSNVKGGFKAVFYDTNMRIALTLRPANFNTLAGTGSSPLFQHIPYLMNPLGTEVKLKWTVKNVETVSNNNIELGIYGIQVSGLAS